MLLRNFCAKGLQQLWVFDKRTGQVRRQTLRTVAVEHEFYEHEHLASHNISLEHHFSQLEGEAAPIFTKILREHSLQSVDNANREVILDFIITQLFRTQSARTFVKLGAAQRFNHELSDEEAKKLSLISMTRDLFKYRIWLSAHTITGREVPRHQPERFLLGDHPVAVWPDASHELPASIDAILSRATITIPLAPRCALFLFPLHRERELRTAGTEYRYLMRVLDALQPVVAGDVENCVRQQVFDANRFVFGSTNDFTDVAAIVRAYPGCESGPWRPG